MLLRVPALTSLIAILLGLGATLGHAQTTDTIAFQGRLANSGGAPPPDGVYLMAFALFEAETGGTRLWEETYAGVPVASGLFVVALGSVTPFPAGLFADNENLFLEITIDVSNDGMEPSEVQSPRTPLNAVPVALHAKDAAMLGGVAAQDIATSAALGALEASVASALSDASEAVAASQEAQDAIIAGKADAAEVADKLGKTGPAYVVPEVTEDPVVNGANLLAAYAQAKALTPHGLPLSATNRAVVMLAPGRYDLGTGQLTLDTEFVDLVGLSTARDNQHIVGASNGPGTGVLAQTASDVRIENVFVECTKSVGSVGFGSNDAAAYFPASDLPNTVIRNCRFLANDSNALSMRVGVTYSGVYEDCLAGLAAFGAMGNANGTFTKCTGGEASFGSSGIASGTFIDCIGPGSSFGGFGKASGKFINCAAGDLSFGFLDEASGDFKQCTGGANSFAGNGQASGTFEDCTGGDFAFGGGNNGIADGKFVDCTGGNFAFGSTDTTQPPESTPVASGEFIRCQSEGSAFGSRGIASGKFADCEGGDGSFGGLGTASGTYIRCTGGNQAFGGVGGITLGASLIDCRMTASWTGTFRGRMENCFWNDGITLGGEARIYGTTFMANVTILIGAANAGMAHCRVKGTISGLGSASFNVANLEDTDVD